LRPARASWSAFGFVVLGTSSLSRKPATVVPWRAAGYTPLVFLGAAFCIAGSYLALLGR